MCRPQVTQVDFDTMQRCIGVDQSMGKYTLRVNCNAVKLVKVQDVVIVGKKGKVSLLMKLEEAKLKQIRCK